MSAMAVVFTHGPPLGRPVSAAHISNPRLFTLSRRFSSQHGAFLGKRALSCSAQFTKSSHYRIRSFQPKDAGVDDPGSSNETLRGGLGANEEIFRDQKDRLTGKGNSFLAKLAIGLGVAATVTVLSITLKQQNPGSSLGIGIQRLADGSTSSNFAASHAGFTLNAFGYRVVLPEYAPGWIYFWLLIAAGCGLFISEEALNIWVGISLSRRLCLDGTWQSFAQSFSANAPYIISTVLWVYGLVITLCNCFWVLLPYHLIFGVMCYSALSSGRISQELAVFRGVCISDMVPFYLGKLFRQSGASDDVCSKLGFGKEKLMNITGAVQRYGNLSGFVERFSIGMRNPTAFLAGAMGVPPQYFFAGVCCGGLITVPVQLGIGFFLRERPLFAVASVATAMGIWTIFPYVIAALTSLFFFVRHISSSS